MNKQQRDELSKLADAATPGPWKKEELNKDSIWAKVVILCHPLHNVGCTHSEYDHHGEFCGGDETFTEVCSYTTEDCTRFHEDGEFIAASRTAIPALLDYIEQLEDALRWYEIRAKNIANMEDNVLCNFSMADLVEDKGQRARNALQMEKP